MKYFAFILVAILLTGCKTTPDFSKALEDDTLPIEFLEGIEISSIKTTDDTFNDYDIGEISTSSSFPEAYIALPNMSEVFGEPLNLSLQTYIKSDNGEKGIVIEYHDNSWTSPPNSNELQRYKLPLLNYPNPSLKIDPNFGKANWLLHFEPMQLSEGKIINLFDNLTAISIDLSRLNWRSTFKDKAHKLINISFLVENDRGQSYRAQIKQTRDGDSYIPPQKLTFFVTNDISNQNLKFVVIAKYGDENGRLIQGKKEFDSVLPHS